MYINFKVIDGAKEQHYKKGLLKVQFVHFLIKQMYSSFFLSYTLTSIKSFFIIYCYNCYSTKGRYTY